MSESQPTQANRWILFSWIGVIIVLVCVILLNFILNSFRTRIDLTEDKLYTLNEGTIDIISELDTPVILRYYATQDSQIVPKQIEIYMDRVEDLLNEYQNRAKDGMIKLEQLNPEPNSDEEIAALNAGINQVSVNAVDTLYNGLEVQSLDNKVILPFLDPRKENLLEYDISRAITEVSNVSKAKIAIMTDQPVAGGPGNPMQGMQGSEPWYLTTLLERDYEVDVLPLSTESIPDDVDILLVIHPTEISEQAEYAIDQYVVKGGKMIAFLDPNFYFGREASPSPMGAPPASSSSLGTLLTKWGLDFSSQTLADMTYVTQLQDGRGNIIRDPRVLSIAQSAMNEDEPASADLQSMLMWEAGVITGSVVPELTKTALITSTENSQLVSISSGFGNDAQALVDDFKADDKRYDLAVLLRGKFKSAFPDGKPAADPEAEEMEDEPTEETSEDGTEPAVTESDVETAVALIGDVDMISDRTFIQMGQDLFGRQTRVMTNSNIVLLQNLIEQMAGDSNLIQIRSRVASQRFFTKIREMEEEANSEFRDELRATEERVKEAEQRFNEIQQQKSANQAFNITPEQQEQINTINKALADAREARRVVERRKDQEIEKTINKLKMLNILTVPSIVIILGIVIAIVRKSKTAAR